MTFQPAAGPLTRLTVHPRSRADEHTARRHRAFALAHIGAAAGAGVCFLAYAAVTGPLGLVEAITGLWLLSPAAIAFVPRLTGSLGLAGAASVVNLTVLVTWLSLITGGLQSFLLVWLIAVPLEAAFSGGRKLVTAAVLLCALALLVIAGIEAAGLPRFLLPEPASSALRVGVIFMALAYAGTAALVLQRSQAALADAARRRDVRYRLLAEHALDMISQHGPDGRLCFVSPACAAILGYGADELQGQPAAGLIHPEDRRRMQTAFSRAIYLGETAVVEYRHRRKDGGYVWLETRCRPVPLEAPNAVPAGARQSCRAAGPRPPAYDLIAVSRDISDQKRQEAELRKARDAAESASRAKSRFLAGMSHELRTPLNAILGFSEVMKSEMFGPLGHPHYGEYARHIHESGEHLRDLIDDVLDLSRIEAGKWRLTPELLDVQEVAEGVIRTMSITAQRAEVALDLHLQPGLPALRADRRAVRQMLLNLVSNAVKFTPKGGSVALSVQAADKSVLLEVRDTGIGIPSDDLLRLAQPFEQAKSVLQLREARKDEFAPASAGSGLGLATVRALAQLHGGSMAITSTPGKGTRVRVALPFGEAECGIPAAPPEAAASDDAA